MSLGFLAVASFVLALILTVIPNVIWLLIYVTGKIAGFHISYAPFGWTALSLAALCLVIMAYGCFIGR